MRQFIQIQDFVPDHFVNSPPLYKSSLSTRCFNNKAKSADKILAFTVLHQIMIWPPNRGGRISMRTSIKTGSIKVKI